MNQRENKNNTSLVSILNSKFLLNLSKNYQLKTKNYFTKKNRSLDYIDQKVAEYEAQLNEHVAKDKAMFKKKESVET